MRVERGVARNDDVLRLLTQTCIFHKPKTCRDVTGNTANTVRFDTTADWF